MQLQIDLKYREKMNWLGRTDGMQKIGITRNDTIWYGVQTIYMPRCGIVCYSVVLFAKDRYYTVRHGVVWYSLVWYSLVWETHTCGIPYMVWHSVVWYGMVWFCMRKIGMAEEKAVVLHHDRVRATPPPHVPIRLCPHSCLPTARIQISRISKIS